MLFRGDTFMRLFFLVVLTCIALTVSVSTGASKLLAAQPGQPARSTGVTSSAAPTPEIDVPPCYVQWGSGSRLVDLTQLCGNQTQDVRRSQVTYPQPPTPYDQAAVKSFDDSVYGEGN